MKLFANSISGRYSKQGLLTLFLMCSLPLHVWTLILAFRDVSWISERTNFGDALGVISYGLIFAFIESLVVFLFFAALGYFIPAKWSEDKRVSLLSILATVAALWAIFNQAYFVWGFSAPASFIAFFARQSHPLRFLYAFALAAVSLSMITPALFMLRSDKFYTTIQSIMDRLVVLAGFYIFLDFLALIVVVVRNI